MRRRAEESLALRFGLGKKRLRGRIPRLRFGLGKKRATSARDRKEALAQKLATVVTR